MSTAFTTIRSPDDGKNTSKGPKSLYYLQVIVQVTDSTWLCYCVTSWLPAWQVHTRQSAPIVTNAIYINGTNTTRYWVLQLYIPPTS